MKLTVTSIETTAETAHTYNYTHHYNHQAKITATGYNNGMEVMVTIKMPYDIYDRIPKLETPLDVSISFDEVITTTKTIKLV